MKSQKKLLAAAFLMAAVMFGCKKDSTSSAFDKSYDTWLTYKQKVNNTYTYTAYQDNQAIYWETKITVVNGSISARDYQQYDYEYDPNTKINSKVLLNEWHESAGSGTIGTHGAEGWGLYTIDDVYYQAQNVWLKANTNTYNITFETNNNGIISTAGYAIKKCVTDDCFIGVHIKSITN